MSICEISVQYIQRNHETQRPLVPDSFHPVRIKFCKKIAPNGEI